MEAQRSRFFESARELGADENKVTFKERLAVIARQKPKDKSALVKPKKQQVG